MSLTGTPHTDWTIEMRTRFETEELTDFFARFNELEVPQEWFDDATHTELSDPGA